MFSFLSFVPKICFSFFHSKTYQTGIEWQVKTSNARKIEENFRMKNKNYLADIDLLFHVEKQIIDLYSFFHSNSLFSKMADQFDFIFSFSFLSSFCLAIFQNVLTSFLTRIPNGRTPTDLSIKHYLNNRLSRIKSRYNWRETESWFFWASQTSL